MNDGMSLVWWLGTQTHSTCFRKWRSLPIWYKIQSFHWFLLVNILHTRSKARNLQWWVIHNSKVRVLVYKSMCLTKCWSKSDNLLSWLLIFKSACVKKGGGNSTDSSTFHFLLDIKQNSYCCRVLYNVGKKGKTIRLEINISMWNLFNL